MSTPGNRRPDRRKELVTIAAELFDRRGYHMVGMRDIAREAGIQSPSIYHHFSSKEDVLYQIVLQTNREFIVDASPLLEGPGSHAERLARLFRYHLEQQLTNRHAWNVSVREAPGGLSPEHLSEVHHYRREYQRTVTKFIAEGSELGEFDCEDPTMSAIAILDMLNGLTRWYHDGRRYSSREVVSLYLTIIMRRVLGVADWSTAMSKR